MKISVIIPALNEEAGIGGAIKSALSGVGSADAPDVEIIVADGGSTDNTVEEARRLGAKVVKSAPGRGLQMDRAASSATGDVLLFLHSDTRLPEGWYEAVTGCLSDKAGGDRVVAGAFTLKIDSNSGWLRFVEYMVGLRARLLEIVYGDQAIFVRRVAFDKVGGFLGLPLMEDVDLVRRLKGEGRIICLKERVLTSARRWHLGGRVVTSAKNWLFLALYFAGVSPQTLYRFYYGRRAG